MDGYRSRLRGGPTWLALLTVVTIYEIAAPADELLTAACARGITKHPVLTRAAIITTAAHLLGAIPRRLDPFTQVSNLLRR
ncbi:hypothetical protein IU443_29715 [Nocardia farcinica]|uniref:Uncharacterized protein n=1 Tax=Nocardia farcinica TaxID=37329 RepID=A0A0H5PPH6_NOCFR|nr:hypothetical protein [Nocardia farcinica]AXK88604.1 hypothetical protein DXT66_25945 [Nocardia farcinica]MBF6394109.1 hypothetical protein [Nocardia farcinica]PFW98698.1 hypothetical protein CJ469_05951 [Nocardia farcinica]PFX04350.1 hypothetical protein CJ468_05596 [Nocardia farcinica]CRY84346.1 Uncharacterised protein [Nocardia farcinica]